MICIKLFGIRMKKWVTGIKTKYYDILKLLILSRGFRMLFLCSK
jgi:hypothetical protein